MRRLILLILLLLTACGGATPYPTPWVITAAPELPTSAYDILPVEAQRVIDRATATAAAAATQAAQATATSQAARETSTAASLATLDALVVRQTEIALSLTAGAGMALATNEAAVRTAIVALAATHARATDVQIAALATPAAAAQAAAVKATGTVMARQEAAAVRRQAADEQIRVGGLLALLGVLLIVLLALGLAFVFGVSDMLSARAAVHMAAAEEARAKALQMMVMQYGGQLLQLRAGQWELMSGPPQIAAPAAAPGEPATGPVHEVPIRAKGEVIGLVQVGVPETPERERVLALLSLAINHVGPHSPAIPSAERLGIHPQEWQRAVDLLKSGPDHVGYIQTTLGRPKAGMEKHGRTRLSQPGYLTLGLLRDGIKRGDVLPRPADPPTPAAPAEGPT